MSNFRCKASRAVILWAAMLAVFTHGLRADDAWQGLGNAELLSEARAAYNLGWTAPIQRAASLAQPTAIELLDRVDASSPSSETFVSSKRLRLLCQIRLGDSVQSSTMLAGLPGSVEGESSSDRANHFSAGPARERLRKV